MAREISDAKILVVDDVRGVVDLVEDILGNSGFDKIHTCVSGLDAIEYLSDEGNKVDIVICDLYMHPVDGIELLKYMTSFDHLKKIPFIMLSGETTKEKVREVVTSGVSDYILKPFKKEHVVDRIVSQLLKRGFA